MKFLIENMKKLIFLYKIFYLKKKIFKIYDILLVR